VKTVFEDKGTVNQTLLFEYANDRWGLSSEELKEIFSPYWSDEKELLRRISDWLDLGWEQWPADGQQLKRLTKLSQATIDTEELSGLSDFEREIVPIPTIVGMNKNDRAVVMIKNTLEEYDRVMAAGDLTGVKLWDERINQQEID
jgi:hypothetical protein